MQIAHLIKAQLPSKKSLLVILVILIIAVSLRLPTFLVDLPVLVSFMPDDGFYYMQIASNFAFGKFSSIDGTHVTNGYHPLWPINIAPFLWLRVLDLSLPIHMVIAYGFVLSILTAWLLSKIMSMLGAKDWLRVLTFAAFLLNPYIIKFEIYCEPAALSNFLLVLLAYLTLKYSQEDVRFGSRQALFYGLAGGLLLLARTDNLLFLALDYFVLFLWCRNKPRMHILLALLVSGIVVSPWLLFNLLTFGTIVQVSSIACPYIMHVNEPVTIWQLLSLDSPSGLASRIFDLQYIFRYSLIFHAFLLIIGMSFAVFLSQNLKLKRTTILILGSIGIGLVLLYSHILIARYLREWHMACAAPFTILLLILVLHHFTTPVKSRHLLAILSISVYFAIALFLIVFSYRRNFFRQHDVLEVIDWVKTQPRGTCAIYDGGFLSYMTDGVMFPIDGNVNNNAHRAVVERKVVNYMKENGVKYLVGWLSIKGRYNLFWGVDFEKAFTKVAEYNTDVSPILPGYYNIWKLNE